MAIYEAWIVSCSYCSYKEAGYASEADALRAEIAHLDDPADCPTPLDDAGQQELAGKRNRLAALAGENSAPGSGRGFTGSDDELDALLTDVYICTRVWSAWGYGTMTDEDFIPAAQDEDITADLKAWRDAAAARA